MCSFRLSSASILTIIKKSVTKEIVNIFKISLRVHQQNAVLEQQRSKSSSSSSSTGSGCCMGFLRCLGTAPAAAPAVAVVPGSSMPLEIQAAPTTAAPTHTVTPLSELTSTLLPPEEQQRFAELQQKMQQLELQIRRAHSENQPLASH